MSDALNRARKTCPQCGRENRIAAKVCTNCGYEFVSASLAVPTQAPGVPLKRCPNCGKENRLSAKVCSQCGHQFQGIQQIAQEAEPAVQSVPPMQNRSAASASEGQKWCPRCGTVCRLEAKVCPHCGHHFRTDFSTRTATDPILTEAPVAQMPPEFADAAHPIRRADAFARAARSACDGSARCTRNTDCARYVGCACRGHAVAHSVAGYDKRRTRTRSFGFGFGQPATRITGSR